MTVKRIVANLASEYLDVMRAFYCDLFELELAMNHGWIQTYVSPEKMQIQLSVAIEGGSNTRVSDLSIEVDNLDEVLQKVMDRKLDIFYGPQVEP
ncbi:MAG: glyoxalase [Acinetobacter populi]|jgi:lactoylglutathione lyase|uniref:glyoxalase n=1 Tax=Acinetobacter populi TaxID=1582270 RepID=UPI002356CE10|nr:glyoxalase [Acinetobacter populi]MCH4247103.1 glyoxalase [Acinetobacter populi]